MIKRSGPRPRPFECPAPVFWYLVGLIASDGCLITGKKCVNITAKDKSFLLQVWIAIGSRGGISRKLNGSGQFAYQLQIGSAVLYDRLTSIGLTPRKSLTIGALKVPDGGFRDFLRGVIDGDGNIRRWRHPTNGREQWVVRICGCSAPFQEWIRETIERLWRVHGALHCDIDRTGKRQPRYTLKYGKLAAKVILHECYYSGALALDRKRTLAIECLNAPVGWSQSKTVSDGGRWLNWDYVHTWQARRRIHTEKEEDSTSGLVAEPVGIWTGRGG